MQERRRAPRYPFYASAQITDLETETVVPARTSELGRYGCYMDMLNPLPLGAAVRIQITHEEQTMDANGHVVYSQTNMGMGMSFDEIQGGHEEILERWLEDAKSSPK